MIASLPTRSDALARAVARFNDGALQATLARLVAIPTESQNPDRAPELARYVDAEMRPLLEGMGFSCRVLTHPRAKGPFLLATRIEDARLPTVLGYGHGDVIRGLDAQWAEGL